MLGKYSAISNTRPATTHIYAMHTYFSPWQTSTANVTKPFLRKPVHPLRLNIGTLQNLPSCFHTSRLKSITSIHCQRPLQKHVNNHMDNVNGVTEEKQHLNLDKLIKQKIVRNHWRLTPEGKATTSDNKLIVPKRDIYNVLCEAPSAIAHQRRDKTERYIRQAYTGISQEIINLFVSLCKLHQQQTSTQTTGRNHYKSNKSKPVSCTCTHGSHCFTQFAL